MLNEMSITPHAVLMEEQLGFPTALMNTLEHPEWAAVTELRPPGGTDSLSRVAAPRYMHVASERPLAGQ